MILHWLCVYHHNNKIDVADTGAPTHRDRNASTIRELYAKNDASMQTRRGNVISSIYCV